MKKTILLLIILKQIPKSIFIKIFNHVINYFAFINTLYSIIKINLIPNEPKILSFILSPMSNNKIDS